MYNERLNYSEVTERYCAHMDDNVVVKKKNLPVGEQLECLNALNCEFGKNKNCRMCNNS